MIELHESKIVKLIPPLSPLFAEVEPLGMPLEIKEIKSFDEIDEENDFNYAGLGAAKLNSDDRMVPVRGHLVALKPSLNCPYLDHMIYTKVMQNYREEPHYMLTKEIVISSENKQGSFCAGVIGGTFIANVEATTPLEQEKLDRIEFENLLNRLFKFFLENLLN